MSRRAFTLIELLVVIGIIAILASILIPALTSAMARQKRLQTLTMMDSLKVAIEAYLGRAACLGAPLANHELPSPLAVLHHDLPVSERTLTLTTANVVRDTSGTGAGPFAPCESGVATHLADAYRQGIRIQVEEADLPGLAGRRHVTAVVLRSTLGAAPTEKQLVLAFDVARSSWSEVRLTAEQPDGRWTWEAR